MSLLQLNIKSSKHNHHHHHSKNEYGRAMIEYRELEDIKRHHHLTHQAKQKKSALKHHHINKREYDHLMRKLKRSEQKMLKSKHKHRDYPHRHSIFNGGGFIQLSQTVHKRKRGVYNTSRNKKKGNLKHRNSLKLKMKMKKSKLKHNLKTGNIKSSTRKLNHNASVQRGVAKIFKGFKLGKRRSAAYKLMHKKSKNSKNGRKTVKSKLNKTSIGNARIINNKSFTQLAANRYFNKYKRYKLKKARIHFHPSNKYKKFKNNLRKTKIIRNKMNKKIANNKFKGRKSVKIMKKKLSPRFKVKDAFTKFEDAINSHLDVRQEILSD